MTPRIALIPAYEPDEKLPHLVDSLTEAGLSAVIVDDGSGADFAPIFDRIRRQHAGATILTHAQNRGKGAAIKTALTYLTENYPADSTVVVVDADGQHAVKDALRCISEAEDRPDALVLGCRRFQGKVPLRSRIGNTITRFVFRLASGAALSDTQTGLRAFSLRLAPELLAVSGERYEYEMNMLLSFAGRIPFVEVPIETIYEDGNKSSHFRTIQDSFLIYRDIFKFGGSSFVSFLLDYGLFTFFSLMLSSLGQAGITAANIGARLISGTVNFLLNRNFVFKSDAGQSVLSQALRYVLLALGILAVNTFLLSFLTGVLHWNALLSKLLVEVTLFLVSFSVQKLFVFRKPRLTER